ncbi:MAG TPA: alpha/beta hydrolase [Stenotrophomonas sp.]|nr:alpha/beta hydrolase [Stenotrophomonas sp.]
MSKKVRIILALLVVAGALGYRYWHARQPADKPAPAMATAKAAPSGQAASASEQAPTTRTRGKLQFHPCTLTSAQAAGNVEAQCATLQVPENPSAPQGRKIGLNIAWLESKNDVAADLEPVFFIAGGPGQSATDVGSLVALALAETRKQRDIFLIDQRGTGGSHPLECLGPDGKALAVPEEEVEDPAKAVADYAARCAAALKPGTDTRFYTTSEAVADLDAVRAALGAPRVDLMGVSYGTRVAQQFAKRYPQHVRAIVLDGVAPNDLVVGGEFATTFEEAIALQSAQCRKDAACSKRFPTDTREQLRNVLARLREAPVEVNYRHPGTGEIAQGKVTADTVVGLAFAFSYAPQTASLLPLVLDEAAKGRYEPLMSLAQLANRQMGGQMNRLMQWSVICAEDAGRYQPSAATASTLLGPEVARIFFAACPVWATGSAPADFTAPLRSQAPVLLLSGELDPVTPPRYAERVLAGLPNGRHLIAPGQGHNVMALGCIPKLIGQFFDTADAKSLDAKCVQDLNRVPAFTTFNGWEP